MNYKVVVSENAHNDLDNIFAYIALELKNISAAQRLFEEVQKAYKSVGKNPKMYAACLDNRLNTAGYRKILVKNYIIIYRIIESEKTVFIARVFYGRQDYEKYI